MVESKLSECAAKFGHCFGRAYQRQGCGEYDDGKANCFGDKLVPRFVLEILTADIPKPRSPCRNGPAPKAIQSHRAIIAVHQRGSVVLANNY